MKKEQLIAADAFADQIWKMLKAAGIPTLSGPLPVKPSPWAVSTWRADTQFCARLNKVGLHITDDVRKRFWAESAQGQGYDDAIGYWLRCWAAAFEMPFKPAWYSRISIEG